MLSYAVEWQVTDSTGVVIGAVGASGGTLTWDGRATIQRVCRGAQFDSADWSQLNPLTDWLVPVFRTADGAATRLGMFTVAGLPEQFVSGSVTAPPEPYLTDAGLLLESASPFNLSGRSGEQLSQVLARVCDAAGVTRRVIEPVGDLIGEPVAYPVGTKFGAALAGFAELAGLLPPHFDRDGVLVLRGYPDGAAAPDVSYDSGSIIAESRVEDSDLFTAPNVWLVIGGGGTGGPVVVQREVAPDAPNSVANRGGRRIVQVLREQGVDSVAQAQRLASVQAELSRQSFRTVAFAGAPNPAHDCYSTVEVNNVRYFETGWSLPLGTGSQMRHNLSSRLELR
jgi:hypothetical protein